VNHVQGAPHIKKSLPPITFTDEEFTGVDLEQDEPMVIAIGIASCDVKKVLIDHGSSIDLFFLFALKRLDISSKLIKRHLEPLLGFVVRQFHTRGVIELETTFRVGKLSKRSSNMSLVMQTHPTTYLLDYLPNALGGNVSIPHLVMKFPNSEGNIFIVKVDQMEAQECYIKILLVTTYNLVSDKQVRIANINNVDDLNLIN